MINHNSWSTALSDLVFVSLIENANLTCILLQVLNSTQICHNRNLAGSSLPVSVCLSAIYLDLYILKISFVDHFNFRFYIF